MSTSSKASSIQTLYSDIEEEPLIEEPTEDAETSDLPGPILGDGGLDEDSKRRIADAELNRQAQAERFNNT